MRFKLRKFMIAIHSLWMLQAVGCGAKPDVTELHGVHIKQSYDAGTLEVRAYNVEKTDVSHGLWDHGEKIGLEINSTSNQVSEIVLLSELPLSLFEIRSADGGKCTYGDWDL